MTLMTEGSGGGEKGPDSRHAVNTEPSVFADTKAGTDVFCVHVVIFTKVSTGEG